jgi:hypothetical protein
MTQASHRHDEPGAGFEPRTTPWQAAALEVAPAATFDEAVRAFVRAAVLAPSGHNTQPWSFAVRGEDVLVFADPERRLPVADPDDRELTMSLGAAVTNLRVAAARHGYGSTVSAPAADGAAAAVRLSRDGADPELAALFPALTARRTWRLAFAKGGLSPEAQKSLDAAATLGAARLETITDGRRDDLVRLIEEGDRERMSEKAFRRELAAWMRPAHSDAPDGLAGDSLGLSSFASDLAAWSTKTFDMGKSVASKDGELARQSAALAVVLAGDEPAALVDAGQLLERFLLTAALHGLSASFFNLAVEVPHLRDELQGTLGAELRPQVLFRIGRAEAAALKPAARRPLSAVLRENLAAGSTSARSTSAPTT